MSGNQLPLRYFDVTINGSATSPDINISGMSLVGIITPASISSTSMTFTAAKSHGGTYSTVKDRLGNDFTLTITSSRFYALNPADTAALEFFRMVGSASETSKTFTLVLRQIA